MEKYDIEFWKRVAKAAIEFPLSKSAKEFVRAVVAGSRIEPQTTNGGRKYYLIRVLGQSDYIASGNTPAQAWLEAKKNIVENIFTEVENK